MKSPQMQTSNQQQNILIFRHVRTHQTDTRFVVVNILKLKLKHENIKIIYK